MDAKKNINVLIVDDEEVVRNFLTQLLTVNGLNAEAAENGFKAIEMARRASYDLVFLDVRMPGIDGLETFRELKKISPDTTYVMMTGYAVNEILEQAKKEGVAHALKKPFDVMQIKKLIDGCIKNKTPQGVLKMLIVDDEEVVLNFFKKLLKEDIYDVVTAKTGKEALENLKEKDFDLAFVDTVLPDMQGAELYLKIQEAKPDLAIVLITGYVERCEDIKQLKLNIKGCLYKPFEIDKIYEEINKIKQLKGL